MNSLIRQLFFVLLTASATAPFAASDAPANQRVEVTAARNALVAAEAVLSKRDLDTVYEMSTGRLMTVSYSGDALQMLCGRRPQATLRHDGKGSFLSSDGQLSLEFALDRDGDPQAVQLSMPGNWL